MQKTPISMVFYILIILFSLVSSYVLAQPEFVSSEGSPLEGVTSNLAKPDSAVEFSQVSAAPAQPGDHLTPENDPGKLTYLYCLGTIANCPQPK